MQLEIPCECSGMRHTNSTHPDAGCGRAAQVWVTMHDVYVDCRQRDGGTLSIYLCHDCWDPLSGDLDRKLRRAEKLRNAVLCCSGCAMHIHRWSDVVFRVVPLCGVEP